MDPRNLAFRVADGFAAIVEVIAPSPDDALPIVGDDLGTEPPIASPQVAGPTRVRWTIPPQHYAEPAPEGTDLRVPLPLIGGAATIINATLAGATQSGPPDLWTAVAPGTALRWAPRADIVATGDVQGWRVPAAPGAEPSRTALWHAEAQGPGPMAIVERRPIVSTDGGVVNVPAAIATLTPTSILLTPIGATARLWGATDTGDEFDGTSVLGRDIAARAVTTGHLATGHRAMVVQTTERRIEERTVRTARNDARLPVAVLCPTAHLVVLDRDVDVDAGFGADHDARRSMPFARLTTAATTYAFDMASFRSDAVSPLTAHGAPLMLYFTALDRGGDPVAFSLATWFIPATLPPAATAEMSRAGIDVSMAAQPVVVHAAEADADAARFEVSALHFAFARGAGSAPIIPYVDRLRVEVESVAALVGARQLVEATFTTAFQKSGLGAANPAGAVLDLAEPLRPELPARMAGGLGVPRQAVDVLTTKLGAVAKEVAGSLTPTTDEILAGLKGGAGLPKLFGTIELVDLLGDAEFVNDAGKVTVPGFTHRVEDGADVIDYTLTARVKPAPSVEVDEDEREKLDAGLFVASRVPSVLVKKTSKLTLQSTLTRPRDGGRATSRSHGTVTDLALTIADIVTVGFSSITFTSIDGGAPDVSIGTPSVQFGGALEFVADLAHSLSELGTGSGVQIVPTTSDVTVRLAVTLADIEVAVLRFTDLRVSAAICIPFLGGPVSFRFEVASRKRPFLVTVSMFGGGGWFALEVDPQGIELLELGIEFGGSLAVNVFVARGSVTAMGGIHMSAVRDGPLAFEVYFRVSGYLSVLGIVTVYAEFVLALGYRKEGGKTSFSGRAMVTLGIEVLFFSQSVSFEFSHEIFGSAADPGFAECFEIDDWREYLAAFAEEATV